MKAPGRGKTPGSRKRPVPKPPSDATRTRLEKELRLSIGQLDEKGLLFLLRQAQVLIHNARVESLRGADTREQPEPAAGPITAPAGGGADAVRIERGEDGKGIFLDLGGTRKIVSAEEMKRMVRICYGAQTRSEAVQHLFTVLMRERRDILVDA
ncbi:MAG TPA: hypothetical protein VFI08_09375, partial [Spirochaetia bacterium]|nr:hypothetical protein [Spirochaetia bacterium]